MSKNNNGLVEFCKKAETCKIGYVYGTMGQVCTTELLNQCAARYPQSNLAGGNMRTVGNKWIGHRVTDCIGLLKWYMMSDLFGQNPVYDSFYDKSANAAYLLSLTKGSMNTLPELSGVCLHMDGHFGIYIGNGYAIEARGTVYGVVKTKISERPWTAWFLSPWIEYIDQSYCDTTQTFSKKVGQSYTFKTGSSIWTSNNGIWKSNTPLLKDDGYFYTTFVSQSKGGAGFYMSINGVTKRVCVGNVV